MFLVLYEIYSIRHKCSKPQIYQMVIDDATDMETDSKSPTSDESQDCLGKLKVTEVEEESVTPVLYFHALNGSQGHNIMRLSAKFRHCEAIILVDFGSAQNFVYYKLVK